MEVIQNKSGMTINRMCGTFIGGMCCTAYLCFGSSSSVVDVKPAQNDYKQESIGKNNIYITFSETKGISYDLSRYTNSNNNESLDSIVINSEKIDNIDKLSKIADLNDGWDGEGAKAFDKELIEITKKIVMELNYQPEIFPTACESIQFEYDLDNGAYLEFEISMGKKAKCFSIDQNGKETTKYICADSNEINKVVEKFYG